MLVSEPDPRTRKEGLVKLAYINSLWDVASLQTSYAIIESVDWVQTCMCSIYVLLTVAASEDTGSSKFT